MGVTYAKELEDEIIDWISNGRTLRDWCRQEGKPHFSTVYDWLDEHPDFDRRFARSRLVGAEVIAQETLAIADSGENDWMERNSPDNPGYALNGEHVQRSKLRVDTRLKLLAKWFPQKYGEKLTTDMTVNAKVEVTQRPTISKEEWMKSHGVAD